MNKEYNKPALRQLKCQNLPSLVIHKWPHLPVSQQQLQAHLPRQE